MIELFKQRKTFVVVTALLVILVGVVALVAYMDSIPLGGYFTTADDEGNGSTVFVSYTDIDEVDQLVDEASEDLIEQDHQMLEIDRSVTSIESAFPELQMFVADDNFAGRSIIYEKDQLGRYFVGFIVHGSGVQFAQVRCFVVTSPLEDQPLVEELPSYPEGVTPNPHSEGVMFDLRSCNYPG